MRLSSYLKIGCAGIFALGILGEAATAAVYDEAANERLRRQYTLMQRDVARLTREISFYEHHRDCTSTPERCAETRTDGSDDNELPPTLELRLEGQ